jgi:uncharacterized membrane protein YbhN (UPF0104 family)
VRHLAPAAATIATPPAAANRQASAGACGYPELVGEPARGPGIACSIRARVGRVGRAGIFATVVATGSLVALAATPHLLGRRLGQAFTGLDKASPLWVGIAGLAFICSLLAMAAAWRVALTACGAHLSRREACARYGIGSLVNTVAPLRLGDAVRVALFSRALARQDRVWTASGALGAIEVARLCCIALLVTAAWALGALPLWPAVGLAALVGVALVVALLLPRNHRVTTKVAHLLAATSELQRSPARAARLLGFVAAATAARVVAATSISAALSLRSPIVAGLLIVAALDLSGQIPLTPGNFGITSGTVAVALTSRGIGLDEALTAGIALQGIETAAGLCLGIAGALQLSNITRSTLRHWTPLFAGVLASAAVITLTSLSLLGDLT